MVDTVFADVSYYQSTVNNNYPYSHFSFRSNDGTFRDPHFAANLSWSKNAVTTGKLEAFYVYFVFEENWQETFATFKSMVGHPHPQMSVVIDVESWGGKIKGNHSTQLNALREDIIAWLNSYRPSLLRKLYKSRDRKRVLAYANEGDRNNIWPNYGDAKWVIANYSYNPKLRAQIIHQFSSNYYIPPFGKCDANSADGVSPKALAKAVGATGPKLISPKPIKKYPKFPLGAKGFYGPKGVRAGTPAHRAQIKIIQAALVRGGFAGKVNASTWIDGVYGPETVAAVKRFRKAVKSLSKSGNIYRISWNRLVRY